MSRNGLFSDSEPIFSERDTGTFKA